MRGYKSSKLNKIENAKNSIVCSLFQQPLGNSKILAGIFKDSGEILDIFQSN